jgi:hypothetical protein
MPEPKVCTDGGAVTVREPFSIRRRGGRKLVLAPDGTAGTWAAPRRHVDNAMVKAIARAFRWHQMLDDGTYNTIAEIAVAEKINESYAGRVLRLTVLHRNLSTSPQREAADGNDAGGVDAKVSGGLEGAMSEVLQLRPIIGSKRNPGTSRSASCKHCPQHRPALR